MKCNPATRVPGSNYQKPCDTESAKQLQDKIAKMNMERDKQDQMWVTPKAIPKATPALTAMVETMKVEKDSLSVTTGITSIT